MGGNISKQLNRAALKGRTDDAKALLQKGALVNYQDRTALTNAAEWGHLAIVNMLLEAGADVNQQDKEGDTAISRVIINLDRNYEKIVKELLEAGADVNAKNKYELTALMLASKGGHTHIVKLLELFERSESNNSNQEF